MDHTPALVTERRDPWNPATVSCALALAAKQIATGIAETTPEKRMKRVDKMVAKLKESHNTKGPMNKIN